MNEKEICKKIAEIAAKLAEDYKKRNGEVVGSGVMSTTNDIKYYDNDMGGYYLGVQGVTVTTYDGLKIYSIEIISKKTDTKINWSLFFSNIEELMNGADVNDLPPVVESYNESVEIAFKDKEIRDLKNRLIELDIDKNALEDSYRLIKELRMQNNECNAMKKDLLDRIFNKI